jgi:hypothetical protein
MTAIGHQSPISVADSAPQSTPARSRARLRIGLFLKYVVLSFAVVLVALITNGAFEVWFSYQEYKCTAAGFGSSPSWGTDRRSLSRCRSTSKRR